MSAALHAGVIGLGVMGQRMLARLAGHARLRATHAWDADPQAVARTLAAYPRLQGAAVNFLLASSPGLAALQAACQERPYGLLGAPQGVRIELAFAAWPRPWQAAAGAWLRQRNEGGFTREVLSHFIFVLQRVLGPAAVRAATPVYPPDGRRAETALAAQLEAGGIPVAIEARVGGDVDDFMKPGLVGYRGCGSALRGCLDFQARLACGRLKRRRVLLSSAVHPPGHVLW